MRIVFIGTGDIGLPVLRWLLDTDAHELVGVVTQPDKPVGREQRIQASPIKAAVQGLGIPVLQPERIKRIEASNEIQLLAPEVIVVMAYGQILPRAVLEIPNVACLNLHASLLPRHRGAAPIQAAIAAGDRETGVTVMYMDEGLDTGDIMLQSAIPITADETGGRLHDRLAEIAPAALERALTLFTAGTAPRIAQDSAQATYAPKLERAHGLIDWSVAAGDIERKLRAFDPWPGAFTVLRDPAGRERKLKIFRGAASEGGPAAVPGSLFIHNDGIAIAASSRTALLLREVQLEGKKRMPAAELQRGNAWIVNARVA
ncbi:MAG: methionyl-tRNA formyltransferase [Verrucomicrobiota bacterium]|nr:methionyl-tRNA formyltransferase [Verrucomicrobiota bacterium]